MTITIGSFAGIPRYHSVSHYLSQARGHATLCVYPRCGNRSSEYKHEYDETLGQRRVVGKQPRQLGPSDMLDRLCTTERGLFILQFCSMPND